MCVYIFELYMTWTWVDFEQTANLEETSAWLGKLADNYSIIISTLKLDIAIGTSFDNPSIKVKRIKLHYYSYSY